MNSDNKAQISVGHSSSYRCASSFWPTIVNKFLPSQLFESN